MTEAENSSTGGSSTSEAPAFERPPATGLRGFWCLIVTQFQGAFSDNVVKNLAVFIIVFGAGLSAEQKHEYGEAIGALFALPFILFSMAGGFLADRCSKRTVMIGVKVFELGIMAVVMVGLTSEHKHLLLAGVFLMGTHSAFFGPSKYGSLPELLPEKKLSWGNGILELGTFVAIILGTVAAAYLASNFRGEHWMSGAVLITLALMGLTTCIGITRVPAADPAKKFHPNFPAEIYRQLRALRGNRPLWLSIVGNTYFNFLGALLLLNLFFYGADVLGVDETRIGHLNVALALGIGLGSLAAGYLSGGKIEYGLVPIGALGLSIFCTLLAHPFFEVKGSLALLALLGFSGGFFIVPVMALIQHKPAREKKGELQATANLLSFVGVFLASGAHWLFVGVAELSPRQIFLVGGVLTFIGALYAVWLLPDALLRFLLWLATHTLYRVRVIGRDNIPAKGGALFVCNHLSLADAVLLQSSTDRPIRFIMLKAIYESRWIKPWARIMKAIPISSELRPREMIKSLQTAAAAIQNGEVVCIFAEGQITRIGQLLPFRRGFERIMKDQTAPIIPVALDGVWGSLFSFEGGKFIWKLPHRIPHPITVNYGKPLPHTATPFAVRQAVQELMAEAWSQRREHMQPLPRAFVRTARRIPFRFAMGDLQTPHVSFGSALVRSVFLARRLRGTWAGQDMVGLLLPPSVGGALTNWAALLCGKAPVNLNYTLSAAAIHSCVQQCDIKTIVTSRVFLEKIKLTVPGNLIFLEDVIKAPSLGAKLAAFIMARLLPVSWLERSLQSTPHSALRRPHSLDRLATVIFSSGSTGEPKGVMLSHYNVGSNIEQLGQVFGFRSKDRMLGVLPFFHSFGFTGTLALPGVLGIGVVYHPNPLDAKTIGPLVSEYAVSFLLATPTFLQIYMRGCNPEDFGSLRLVAVGAEKLPERLASAFDEQFGIRPFEAYGCTECSPAVTVNTHDFRAAGFRQVGGKRGKIGHPLPGISVRILNPETREPVELGQPGLLLVRGPNVMVGYLGKPEKTAEVLFDGWYTTGDIAALDEDGFLQITDRLSRFSKIGGEMVPHIKVEEKLHELAGVTEQTFVVTSVADEKKGERLVVLHKLTADKLASCLEKLTASDLPNLWKPKADGFIRVESFPMLGTGKLDLRKVKEEAQKAQTQGAPVI
ncbi:MAG TPA: acyl-[ACP]--phospholipid O-acyltransferase [Verrucomicrobiae bacterium]|nr:acyl-[ACP]--phospholipid O-acyltransferase [Verrucomicrobiae bacterium]